jgi:hypothetical protein
MAKKYKIVEDKDDNGSGLAFVLIALVVIFILFFLGPGILISSLINFFFRLEGRIIWAISIIGSVSLLIYLYFSFRERMFIIYLWICGLVTILILTISLIIPDNIFLNTLGRMFNQVELNDCQSCGGDGCIDNTELSNLISPNSYKSEEEIKLFQDWLDKNHPLWINDNGKWKNLRVGTESEPNRHLEGIGYGIFDQRTTTQFEKWGSDYYKVGPCPICNNDGTCSDDVLSE